MPMPSSLILSQVRAYIQENFLYAMPNLVLQDEDHLMKKGVIDSIGVAELLAFLEEEFGITVADTEITEHNLGSLSAIAAFVERKRTAQSAG